MALTNDNMLVLLFIIAVVCVAAQRQFGFRLTWSDKKYLRQHVNLRDHERLEFRGALPCNRKGCKENYGNNRL
jgi:hypothetical protein